MRLPFGRKDDSMDLSFGDDDYFFGDGLSTSNYSSSRDTSVSAPYEEESSHYRIGHDEVVVGEHHTKKKSMGQRLKMLNCSAAHKNIEQDLGYAPPPEMRSVRKRDSKRWGFRPVRTTAGGSSDSVSEITRPVMVTVNDGVNTQERDSGIDRESSFVIGGGGGRSKTVSFGRNPPPFPIPAHWADYQNNSPSSKRCFNRESTTTNREKEMNDAISAQELARKSRWRRALTIGRRDDNDYTPQYGDSSTVSGSVGTGFDSASYTTGYTSDGTHSDESDGWSTIFASHHQKSRDCLGGYQSSTPRGDVPGCSQSRRSDLWGVVAADMRIVADLILADGAACVGGVADITGETVTSCRPDSKY